MKERYSRFRQHVSRKCHVAQTLSTSKTSTAPGVLLNTARTAFGAKAPMVRQLLLFDMRTSIPNVMRTAIPSLTGQALESFSANLALPGRRKKTHVPSLCQNSASAEMSNLPATKVDDSN